MRTSRALAILAVVAALAAPVAATAETRIRAVIPFEFVAGGVTLPAGHYEFTQQSLPLMLNIWNIDQAAGKVVLVTAAYEQKRGHAAAHVVFNKYGDRYFLSEVWGEGSVIGQRLPETRLEREASLKAAAQTTLIAAR